MLVGESGTMTGANRATMPKKAEGEAGYRKPVREKGLHARPSRRMRGSRKT